MATGRVSGKRARHWGAGTAAVVRLLVAADHPMTGVAIASTVGISQPRASQVLRLLGDVVRPSEEGYVGQRARLLDLYRRHARPALVEPERYWYSTRPTAEQIDRVLTLAKASAARVALSSDLAVDLLAPWRHPTLTILYSDVDLPLDDARFVPAQGRGDASIVTRWTSDRTLLTAFGRWPGEVDHIPLTDPTQQWADLLDLGGDDRSEAADRLRRAILSRSIGRDHG
jgi:hypothetical protein